MSPSQLQKAILVYLEDRPANYYQLLRYLPDDLDPAQLSDRLQYLSERGAIVPHADTPNPTYSLPVSCYVDF